MSLYYRGTEIREIDDALMLRGSRQATRRPATGSRCPRSRARSADARVKMGWGAVGRGGDAD